MISTLLVTYSAAVPVLALLLLAALVVVAALLRGRPRAAGGLAAVAVAVALVLTLTPDSATPAAFCRVRFSWPTVRGVEAFANVLLLVPAALLGAVATRRPVAVAAAGAGLSAAVELLQALVPSMGRACDTGDWQANTIGVLGGAVAGWWLGRLASPAGAARRRLRLAATVAAGAAAVAWIAVPALVPAPSPVDPCESPLAGAPTRLPGDVRVTAGSGGGLCFASPTGTSSLPAPIEPGSQFSDDRWDFGVAPAGAAAARDARGRSVRLLPVAGSDLLVWAAPVG